MHGENAVALPYSAHQVTNRRGAVGLERMKTNWRLPELIHGSG